MTIEVIQNFTPDQWTQSFPDLKPGDTFLFAYSNTDGTWPNYPADCLSLLAQPGDTSTTFTVVESPDDNWWMPWFNTHWAEYDDTTTTTVYLCLWAIADFAAGNYDVTFSMPGAPDERLRWGKLIRGMDLAVWGVASPWPTVAADPQLVIGNTGDIEVNDFPATVALGTYDDALVLYELCAGGNSGDATLSDQGTTFGTQIEQYISTKEQGTGIRGQLYLQTCAAPTPPAAFNLDVPAPDYTVNELPIHPSLHIVIDAFYLAIAGDPSYTGSDPGGEGGSDQSEARVTQAGTLIELDTGPIGDLPGHTEARVTQMGSLVEISTEPLEEETPEPDPNRINVRFVQWQAFVGPAWQPKTAATAWDWSVIADLELTGAGTLTSTMASGDTTAAHSGIALPSKGGAWLGPNGTGEAWEYIDYAGNAGALTGLVREPAATREHNGAHTSGAAVRLWAPITTDDGKLHIVRETNSNLNATTWNAELSGVLAPRAFIRRFHALYIRMRYTPSGPWVPYLLGWIQEFTIEDDYRRFAKWTLKVTSIAGILEQIPLKPLHTGDLDLLQYGKVIKQDVTLASHFKERHSGDYTAADPDLRAQSAIDANDKTPWFAERLTGEPGELGADRFNEGGSHTIRNILGQVFVGTANLTIYPGQGKGYRWLQLITTFGGRFGHPRICNKNGPLNGYWALDDLSGGFASGSRIVVCENLSLFSANNPIADPTRIAEVGTGFFDAIDLTGDCLGIWDGASKGMAIKWGTNTEVRWKDPDGDTHGSMGGPCITAPLTGQVMRFHYAGNHGYEAYRHYVTDYADMACYEPSGPGQIAPWFLVQLPGMGLLLKADLATGYTGILEIWDGKTTQTNGLPSSGTLQIGAEQITYNNRTSTTINLVARGAGGTTATGHSAGDAVYFVDPTDWNQATDAFAIKQLSWQCGASGIHPLHFKVYGSKLAAQPRYPVADDEDPNFDFEYDYEKLADVTNWSSNTWTLPLSPSKRITWLLVSISQMSTWPNPNRVRLHTAEALLDTATLDASLWLPDYATTDQCFLRLLENAGIPWGAITTWIGMGSTQPLKLTTAKGFAWAILTDVADYTSVYIEVDLLSHITLRTNNLWRTDAPQTPTSAWTRANSINVQLLAERPTPIAQLQLKWLLPNGDEGGTIVFPATMNHIGEIQTLTDAMYPDATKAIAALERRYLVVKYPFSIGVESARGNDSLKPGEFNTLTWNFTDGTATRTTFVRDVEHTIERFTWKTAVRLVQLREEF